MTSKFYVARGADFSVAYKFPTGTDFTGYTAAFYIYLTLGGAFQLSLSSTPNANGSKITASGNLINLFISSIDINALPTNSDGTDVNILFFDCILNDATGLLYKIQGGPFIVQPLGSIVKSNIDTLSVAIGSSEYSIIVGIDPNVLISANSASASAASAETSASNASTSETNSANSATASANSSSAASASAESALISANSAAASANEAAATQTEIENSLLHGGVLYSFPQSLSGTQQAQARSNISVYSTAEIDNTVAAKASTDLDNLTATAAPVVQSLVSNNGAGGTFVFNPYGQVVTAKANILVDQSATDATGIECFLSVNIDCNISTTGEKVGIYTAMNAHNGTSDVWALNSLTEIVAGNTSSNGVWSYEADLNNFSRHSGETLGPSGMGAPIYRGIGITGYSAYRCTAAVTIDSNNITQWNRGFVASSGSVVQSAFADYSDGAISLDIWGSHTNGIDMSNATISGNILKGPNNFSITSTGQVYFGDLEFYTSTAGGNPAIGLAEDGYIYYSRTLSKFGVHAGGNDTLGVLVDQVDISAARLSQNYGTPGAGAPSGNWAAQLLNYADTDGENGLVIGNHFAADSNRVLSVGSTNDGVYGGAYHEFFSIRGAGAIFCESLQASTSYADDTAAAAGGISVGQFYRNGSVAQLRIS